MGSGRVRVCEAELTARSSRAMAVTLLAFAFALGGCGDPETRADVSASRAGLVYGDDDRTEVFESSALDRELALSMAVLLPVDSLDFAAGSLRPSPTLSERVQLCPEEPFANEPSLAFCTGVLLDYDLLLTAAHCVHEVALSQVAVAFGFFYARQGVLQLTSADVYRPIAVVAERADPATEEPRVDYAWLRLSRSVQSPWQPVRGFRTKAAEPGQALSVLSSTSGTPIKVDHGAAVTDARGAQRDYFTASSDTFGGSSGCGAFDENGVLLGTLSRGQIDYAWTLEQCNVPIRKSAADANEQFSYASRAVEGLCATPDQSSLCRADCGDPCVASPRAPGERDPGCGLAPQPAPRPGAALVGLGAALLLGWRARCPRLDSKIFRCRRST